ncbi:MAG: enolase C-terminal domain-like protein [Acidimicrobiia bacterium]
MTTPILPGAGLEAWAVDLPLRRPFATSLGTITSRRLAIVAIAIDGLVGWGEAAPYPGHTEPFDRVWAHLRTDPGPAAPQRAPTAVAAIDEAVGDLAAKAAGVPLWAHLGGSAGGVAAGATVGLAEPAARAREVAALHAAGYRAFKLKIDRSSPVEEVAALREAYPDVTFGADANGSFPAAGDTALARWDRAGLAYLEQPLPVADLAGLAALARRFVTPIALDESAADPAAAREALAAVPGAVLTLKAGRLGTRQGAALAGEVAAAGSHLRVGGLVESGIGRSHAVALATLPAADVVGDLAASDRYFVDDLVDPSWRLDGAGRLLPRDTPGIGVDVDRAALDRRAFDHIRRPL